MNYSFTIEFVVELWLSLHFFYNKKHDFCFNMVAR